MCTLLQALNTHVATYISQTDPLRRIMDTCVSKTQKVELMLSLVQKTREWLTWQLAGHTTSILNAQSSDRGATKLTDLRRSDSTRESRYVLMRTTLLQVTCM